MKIRFYLATALAALVMTNCSHEEEMPQAVNNPKSFTATIEGASRSAVTEEGVFSWTYGDKFSVWNGETFDVYANSEEDVNTFVAEDNNAGDAKGYAIYPSGLHGVSDNAVTVNLPATYPYGSTNAAMLATIEEGSTNLAFKHLGGLMRFTVEDVPANATSFVFTATSDIITGGYTVDSEGEIKKDGEGTVNNNNSVTISFDALTETQNMTFYVPLPVGTYGGYKVEIKGENINLSHESTGVTNTIGRRTLLLMPVFTVEGNELKKGAGSVIDVTAGELVSVSGNQSLTINVPQGTEATATLTLNYTPQDGNATLSLSDGSDATEPQESAATVKVVPTADDVAVEALNINTPTLTVELGAGQYGTVEALTATQTLKIGSGVTIGTLVLNGGNLEVGESATIEEVVVKDAAGFTNALTAGAASIVLGADIALANCLSISNDVILNLNNHKLTATGTAIYVTAGTLTIEGEGTVNAANGTAQCAVWSAGGSVNIKGGTFSVGLDAEGKTNSCIYSTGGTITIDGGTFSNAAGTYGGGGVFNVKNSTSGKIVINAVDGVTVGEGSVIYESEDVTNSLIEDKRQ